MIHFYSKGSDNVFKRIKVVFMELGASLIAQLVKNLPAMQETPV